MEFLSSVSKDKFLITTKWIFSVKRDSNNIIFIKNLCKDVIFPITF